MPDQNTAKPSDTKPKRPSRAELTHLFSALDEEAMIDMELAAAVLDSSKATIWRLMKEDPDFPKIVRLSKRSTKIRVGDLLEYLRKKVSP
jgi:predicted DNA-binding transcriptional regulator AlpA